MCLRKISVVYLLVSVSCRSVVEAENSKIISRSKRGGSSVRDAVKLTQAEQRAIVNKHNEFRRSVEPAASDMLKLAWSDELAEIAESHSRKCVYKMNPNRNPGSVAQVGENLYFSITAIANVTENLEKAVLWWHDQRTNYRYESDKCDSQCGQYKQLTWANTNKVGCGATVCSSMVLGSSSSSSAVLVVCDYAPTAEELGQPYEAGDWCSACTEAHSACENKLCVVQTSEQPAGPPEEEKAFSTKAPTSLDTRVLTDADTFPDHSPTPTDTDESVPSARLPHTEEILPRPYTTVQQSSTTHSSSPKPTLLSTAVKPSVTGRLPVSTDADFSSTVSAVRPASTLSTTEVTSVTIYSTTEFTSTTSSAPTSLKPKAPHLLATSLGIFCALVASG